MTERTTGRTAVGRSAVGTAALVATAVSAVALVVMIVLNVVGVEGFSSDGDSTAAADATWLIFAVGALLALVLGILAWVRGRSRAAGDVRAGQVAVGYFVLAAVVTAIAAALTGS